MPFLRQISIHALRKESDLVPVGLRDLLPISIHALRKESDRGHINEDSNRVISIHALRKESDGISPVWKSFAKDFNPRSP